MVYIYSGLMVTILLAQFGSAIAAFVLKDDLTESIEHKMTAGLHNYNKTGYAGVTETWDYVQQSLTCCGVTNNTDWTAAQVKTPASCCQVHLLVWRTETDLRTFPEHNAALHSHQQGHLPHGLPLRHGGRLRG